MTSYTWFATEKKLSRKLLSTQKQNWHLQILWSVKANYFVSKCVSIRTLCGRQFHFNFGFDSGLTIWLLSVKCILSTGAFIYKLLLLQSSRLLLLSQAQENTKEKKSSLSSFWAYKLIVCTREDWADSTHAISLISFKLSQFMRVSKLLNFPERFRLPADPWGIRALTTNPWDRSLKISSKIHFQRISLTLIECLLIWILFCPMVVSTFKKKFPKVGVIWYDFCLFRAVNLLRNSCVTVSRNYWKKGKKMFF